MYSWTSKLLIVAVWLAFMMFTSETADNQPASGTAEISDVNRSQTRQIQSRQQTEKGKLYEISRLRSAQVSSLAAVTRKRNEITRLMNEDGNLHLVKSALESLNDLFVRYQGEYHDYYSKLSVESDQLEAMNRFEQRQKSFLDFRNQVKSWIVFIENQLSEQLDYASVSEVGETKEQRKDIPIEVNFHVIMKNRVAAYLSELHHPLHKCKKKQRLLSLWRRSRCCKESKPLEQSTRS